MSSGICVRCDLFFVTGSRWLSLLLWVVILISTFINTLVLERWAMVQKWVAVKPRLLIIFTIN